MVLAVLAVALARVGLGMVHVRAGSGLFLSWHGSECGASGHFPSPVNRRFNPANSESHGRSYSTEYDSRRRCRDHRPRPRPGTAEGSVARQNPRTTGWSPRLRLGQNGFEVIVYEKEAYVGERVREWTMLLHWALPTLRALLPEDIIADLRSAYTDPFYPYEKEVERVPFYNAAAGELAFEMPATSMRRISRNKMRMLCSRGLDIKWGKSVKELGTGGAGPVTIVFDDGTTAEADLVVASDGPNSRVRRWLLGEEAGAARPSEHAICSGIVEYGNAEKAKFLRVHPVASAGLTPVGSMYLGGERKRLACPTSGS